MKLGSVIALLEEVERTYADTGKPIDPKLREAYDEVKAEADACLKAFDELLETEEVARRHREDRRTFVVVLVCVAVPAIITAGAIVLEWLK